MMAGEHPSGRTPRGPRRQRTARGALATRYRIAEAYHRLHADGRAPSVRQVARELSLGVATVQKHLTQLGIEWQETAADLIAQRKVAALRELDWIREQARAEWERSKLDAETLTTEQHADQTGLDPSGKPIMVKGKIKNTKVKKGQTGLAAYLETMRGAWADERKILGIDAPVKSEQTNIDLNQFTDDELLRIERGESPISVLRSRVHAA